MARLEKYIAQWRVIEHHFNIDGDEVRTAKGTEEIAWVLGKRAIQRTYTTGIDSPDFRAIGMLTWDDVAKKYRGVWFDNLTTVGPTITQAEWNEGDQTMVYTLESLSKDLSRVRHRVIERFLDAENRVATTYLLRGDKTIKRLEVQYQTVIPCPPAIRTIDEFHE